MSDVRVLRTLRVQAWERAKGEMNSMLQTFWGEDTSNDSEQFNVLSKRIENFIKEIEDEGLHE